MTLEIDYTQEGWEERAAAALRERQGAGARYDSPNAPKADLALARRGTAYFLRKLMELPDEEFAEPSLLPGWSRARVIAHVGYNARAITRLVAWARTGIERPMYDSAEARDEQLVLGETLPTRALRHLIDHSSIHLNVEWRDLTDEQWTHEVRTFGNRVVPATETVWMRAREVWIHAVDLDNHGSFLDFPAEFVDRLIDDVTGAWTARGESLDLALVPTDRADARRVFGPGSTEVTGAAADLARWLVGRGARRLACSTGSLPQLPRWL